MKTIHFVFAIHNHQPVDNFDHVFARAYDQAYKPFLDLMDRHPSIPFCAHFSGCLLEWLAANRLDVFIQIERMVKLGRLELIGGGFYEPIFVMLPERDRIGQIEMMSEFLRKRFGCTVRGAWLPERIWEPQLAHTLAAAGVEYTILDDFHFKAAGISGDRLHGAYLTEDQGKLLTLFNINETLRYAIPFENDVDRIIAALRELATEDGSRVVVYADDGEKFGVWPNTHRHVYADGWLERFLRRLEENQEWLRVVTFSRALAGTRPLGRVYLPTASYREMGEWSLPTESGIAYQQVAEQLKREGRFPAVAPFLHGGIWRNFRVKYPEANWMYGRMLDVSDQVDALPKRGKVTQEARAELYRAQCNCGYWHGQFGGLYLPHLRASIYHHLIAAESIAAAAGAKRPGVAYRERDIDLDGRPEIVMTSEALTLIAAPSRGGQILELDLREKRFNLLASLARRQEWYHPVMIERARQQREGGAGVASIHDGVQVRRGDLEANLFQDAHPRASLVDHFYDPDVTLEDVAASRAEERGDFVQGEYAPEVQRVDGGACLRLERVGILRQGPRAVPLRVQKTIEMDAPGREVVALYTLALPDGAAVDLHFAVELNFALLAEDGGQRYYHTGNRKPIGNLGARLDLAGQRQLYLVDAWQGIEIAITCSPAADYWTYPVKTVSQSESEYELIYQSSVVLPRWKIRLEPGKPWQLRLTQRFGQV